MPSLIKRRSYYDQHEIQGGMFPFDQIANVARKVVSIPVEAVKSGVNLADEALRAHYIASERNPGEKHARVGNRSDGRAYAYVGPGTDLKERLNPRTGLPKREYQPINSIDAAALRHDVQYGQIASDYQKNPTSENKRKQLKRIHEEDDIFIDTVKRHRAEDPKVADLAVKMIKAKKFIENVPVLGNQFSKKYSGFGMKPRINICSDEEVNDPVQRLRQLAIKQNTVKKGGFIPPFLIPILAAAGSTLVGKVYDTIKEKIEKRGKEKEGKGIELKHKTIKQKRKFLINLAKQIKS